MPAVRPLPRQIGPIHLAAAYRPRWLFIAPQIPRPERASGDRRLFAMLAALAVDCDVALLAIASREPDAAAAERALIDAGVRFVGYGANVGIAALVRETFDAVCFEFYHTAIGMSHFVRALQPQALLVVDSVDLHFLREREAARLGAGDLAASTRTETDELAVYRQADVTIVVTSSECDVLHGLGLTSLEIVPNIVPLIPRNERSRESEVLFIGGFRHPPNGAAVHWFGSEVWPSVRQRVPDARWMIVGSDAPLDVKALDGRDGITVTGFVESTAPWLDAAQVSIAPLTFGAGMKGKVSEALSAGVPVVTTRWGAQGLERGAGIAYLLADTPSEFADAVVRLLRDSDLRDTISHAATELARQTCTIDAAAPALAALVQRSRMAARGPASGRMARCVALGALVVRRRLARLTG